MSQPSTTTTYGGLRGLLDRLDALHAAREPALLGLVVATEGSTYQKPGALVLLARGGLRHGVISGGCLEPELERRAAAVFASGRAALTEFDTRTDEDLLFGGDHELKWTKALAKIGVTADRLSTHAGRA